MRARWIAPLVSATLLAATFGCQRGDSVTPVPPTEPTSGAATSGGRALLGPAPEPGVRFRLDDADPAGPSAEAGAPVSEGVPLDQATIDQLLARLPALPEGEAVQVDFALRPGPRPPVVTGETIAASFPPEEAAPAPDPPEDGALEVARFQPEGEVPMALQLAVTFSGPMVPLTSHAAAVKDIPVVMDPQPEGAWRWVGTRTLLFEPKPRFPMATEYRVEVPAGTRSETGGTLDEAVAWTFRTPPPRVTRFHPVDGPTVRQPVMLAEFDQAVDAEAVLGHVTARSNGADAALRIATAAEIEADETVRRLRDSAADGRWLALAPVEPLPVGAEVEVTFEAGLPSAEGPLTTVEDQAYEFAVYDALDVEEYACAGPGKPMSRGTAKDCEPAGGWWIRFTNPLDEAAFDPSTVTVAPEVPGLRVMARDRMIHMTGLTKGRTDYAVTLPAALADVFGQTLGEAREIEFRTGDARPALIAPGGSMVVLDPHGPRALTVHSINNDELAVRLYRVAPTDWTSYRDFDYARGRYEDEALGVPPGQEIWSGTVRTEGKRDELTAVAVDLGPALTDELGQVVAVVEPVGWSPDDKYWSNRPVWRWVQSTQLGLDAFTDGADLLAWVTTLADGAPIGGAEVALLPEAGVAGSTGDDGLTTIDVSGLPDERPERPFRGPEPRVLVAHRGGDTALLAEEWSGNWDMRRPGETLSWFVFDDRGLYQPGEEVHVKGWLRRYDPGRGGDVASAGAVSVEYALVAFNGEDIASGTMEVTDRGGFDLVLTLPEDVELGQAWLRLEATGDGLPEGGREHMQAIQIAEFRRPEFEVTATAEAPSYLFGQRGVVTAQATYYAGGALPGSEVRWSVHGSATTFTPPGRDEFQFGIWRPWWFEYDFYGDGPGPGGDAWQEHIGLTDATGAHRLAIDFEGIEPTGPATFTAEATVEDVNRQAWTGSTTLLVHPANHYVGLRADRWFVRQGEAITIEAIVADLDGALVEGTPIAMTAERLDWTWRDGEVVEEPKAAGACEATSAAEPVACAFQLDEGGRYRLTAEIVDDEGRPNLSQLTLWVSGGQMPPSRALEEERAELVPDAEEYAPGDTAEILVLTPFTPAEGLLTIQRSGLVKTETFRMDEPSTTLQVPVDEGLVPNFTVRVDLVGAAPRIGSEGEPDASAAPRPAFASGSLDLKVPPRTRTLSVEAVPAAPELAPGGTTTIEVTVRDADGEPLADAEVALVVADEAVLALTGYRIPDPVATFYPHREPGVMADRQRRWVQLADVAELVADEMVEAQADGAEMEKRFGLNDALGLARDMAFSGTDEQAEFVEESAALAAPMLAENARGGGLAEAPPVVAERTNMNPLAAFVPALRTDAEGRVSVEVALPDSVTRYRVTAVAVDEATRFGRGEAAITARLPLIVRPSAPRFLNFGDTFELPIVVQNQGGEDLAVDVVVRAANLALTEGAGRRVTVPAGNRVEVRFPAAAVLPGTAVFQAGAFSGSQADAQRVSLPVWTPATTEAFATYGEIDEGALAQPVERPPDVVDGFGGLEVTTSATALANLTDAFLYLQTYPYECAEQTASRLVATVALRDVLAAFAAEGLPSADEIDAAVVRDIERLTALQNRDGGYGWWRRGERSSPFLTVHVGHALARANTKGYAVPEQTMARVTQYLRDIEQHLDAWEVQDGPYRDAVEAYALYARTTMGDQDKGAASALLRRADEPLIETLGWLLAVLAADGDSGEDGAAIRRQLGNRVSEEAATAQFTGAYEEEAGSYVLASDRRADAVALEALIVDQPESDLIPKLVRGLLDHRTKGRWGSTQENAFVLLALDRYFRTYEAEAPDFVARAWLGDGYLGESAFRGRTPDRGLIEVPLDFLPDAGTETLVLAKDGPGRLYYRLGLRYAPDDLALEPAEHGFSVTRSYEALDDPEDVRRTTDGTWEVRAGARVRVRLTMVAPARRYHVALVDPLPAGLEALNPELDTTATIPPDEAPVPAGGRGGAWRWWWARHWYDHEAFRHERTEAFTSLLWPGVYSYTYVARATTPGEFVVPPAKAEEMYHPETFGRTGTDRVVVR